MNININKIKEILRNVPDPEIPVISIEELGILQDVNLEGDKIIVYITPTYNGCPAMDMITVNIKAALQEHGYPNIEVRLVLSPIWTTDWITDKGKQKLLEYGIAPPVERTTDTTFIEGITPSVACPQCGSKDTEMISRFGSTACKALYKCKKCLEPFDYFKCH